MLRTTVMLPDDLKASAERRARQRGISFGELLRESLAAMLTPLPASKDALLLDDAVYKGKTPKDFSAEHDRYLYGGQE